VKIIIYCQHVLGIGHFIRTLSLCRALDRHDIILITGGEPVRLKLPPHIKEIRLPSLMMNENFQDLHTGLHRDSLREIKALRCNILQNTFKKTAPDLFLVELYPFGRKAFRFELDPVLERIQSGMLPYCRILCSVRDILVEKENTEKHEERVLTILNTFFNGVLIHADPKVVTLDQTFGQFEKINLPVVYTGYVTEPPPILNPIAIRDGLGLTNNTKLVVVSAGGGKVGGPLFKAISKVPSYMSNKMDIVFVVFTGPFANEKIVADLKKTTSDRFRIIQFSSDFPSYLHAADLSISMAGYNTCMNLIAAKVPAWVLPFDQNREQGLRAKRLSDLRVLNILTPFDLAPDKLADIIQSSLTRPPAEYPEIDLNGAKKTAKWIEEWMTLK
jgi:predicted glycosyltransferase